jgi:hypothetical protein
MAVCPSAVAVLAPVCPRAGGRRPRSGAGLRGRELGGQLRALGSLVITEQPRRVDDRWRGPVYPPRPGLPRGARPWRRRKCYSLPRAARGNDLRPGTWATSKSAGSAPPVPLWGRRACQPWPLPDRRRPGSGPGQAILSVRIVALSGSWRPRGRRGQGLLLGQRAEGRCDPWTAASARQVCPIRWAAPRRPWSAAATGGSELPVSPAPGSAG